MEDFESMERVNRFGFVGEMIERSVEKNGLYWIDLGSFVGVEEYRGYVLEK